MDEMAGGTTYRFVGGPFDGRELLVAIGVSMVVVEGHDDMAYHRTIPSDWPRQQVDWWSLGQPEPVAPPKVMEWHERDWMSPEVAMIRSAVTDASDRLLLREIVG